MTDRQVFNFGSFTEEEIKSLQKQPAKNTIDITFGSLDAATLRSVGIFNTQLTEPDCSKELPSVKLVSKQNDEKPLCIVENPTRSGPINAEANGNTSKVNSGQYISAGYSKPSQGEEAFSSESISNLSNHSNLKQHVRGNATPLSTSSLSGGDEQPGSKGNVNGVSNGPAVAARQLLPRGLINLGNLCFLNATLQALLSCSPFVQLLQELRCRDIPEIGYPALRAFVEFISDFDIPPNSSTRRELEVLEAGQPFRPLMFESILKVFTPDIPNCLSGRPRQEDAQEFLSFVMHQMHDELLKLDGLVSNGDGLNTSLVSSVEEDNDDDHWETVGRKNKTAITRTQSFVPSKLSAIFGGQLQSVVKARGSKASATIQPFLLLHLNICPDPVCTIQDALKLFSAPEALEGYRTSAVGKSQAEVVNASKSVKILGLSKIMVLHLMRFSYEGQKSTKLRKPIHFPLELVLGRELLVSTSEGRRYELVATITHHGMDPSKGHYTADARLLNGKWLRFDDQSVTSISDEEVLHNQAYVLFYWQS
ncbi:ubiquitin carboxyl-terminal hydrolase 24-like isoform X1 [Coffea eugenioides]|uniref:ubiquitin carboxyl-terminal hydrolase 24-like isoform X1 n=1 Tax=Coffea eugenioides TaxID=49369 RepID=UPI000F61172E|nr:ubiquitin carboxyl-terminal hydrolase 24-like isoform X1 [Coffea eugenioides]